DDLDGRPPASAGIRRAHVGRLLDRQMGRRHADGRDQPHQAGLDSAQRAPGKRSRDARRACHPPWRLPDAHQRAHRSGVPDRAAGEEPELRVESTAAPRSRVALALRNRRRGRGAAGRRRAALSPGRESVRQRVRDAERHSRRGRDGRSGNDVSRISAETSAALERQDHATLASESAEEPMTAITRLHHITLWARGAQEDIDFLTQVLGLRLIKQTVLFDGRYAHYHFYYANANADIGSVLTTFPYRRVPGRPGSGQISATSFAVGNGTLKFWTDHLDRHQVEHSDAQERFGQPF